MVFVLQLVLISASVFSSSGFQVNSNILTNGLSLRKGLPRSTVAPLCKKKEAAVVEPEATAPTTEAVPWSLANDVGVMAPTGFWDPLGLATNITDATFTQYRTSELKHGRAAMLCVLGYIVPELYKFPGDIAPGIPFRSIPNGVAAIDAIPALGWLQIVFLIGAVDYYGYLGSYAFGQAPTLSADDLFKRQQSELAHCRLAMLASMELLRHDAQNYVIPNFDGLGDHLITGLPFLYV